MLASFSYGEYLLLLPCWLHFYVGSFSYTSHASSSSSSSFFFFFFYAGSFSYTSRAALIFMRGVSLTYPVLSCFLCKEFLLHIPCCFLFSFLFFWGGGGGGLLHIQCWFHFYVWSFSCISHAGVIFIWEYLLRIACWFHFYLGSFSYTSRASFHWISGHISFIFMWGISLTHPMLTLFLCGKFLLHIPCCLHFSAWSFSYTSHADFVFMWKVSLTHPVLPSFFCLEFLLHIPCCLDF